MIGLIADVLLVLAACGAAVYCGVLARKIKTLSGFESGLGGAIAVLSQQVDDLKRALTAAQTEAGSAKEGLRQAVQDAEEIAERLDVMMASLHDLPDFVADQKAVPPEPEPEPVFEFAHARRARTALGGETR